MGLQFPATPVVGELYPAAPVAGVPQWTWNGTVWTTGGFDPLAFVAKTGDTMTGHLSLPTNPTPAAANAVRKDYVDGKIPVVPSMATDAEARAATDPNKTLSPRTHAYSHTPAFRGSRLTAQPIAPGSWTVIVGMTQNLDTDERYDGTRFTPNVPGWYLVTGLANVPTVGGYRGVGIYMNGAMTQHYVQDTGGSTATVGYSITAFIYFNGTTDYIELAAMQDYGAAGNCNLAYFSAHRMFPQM